MQELGRVEVIWMHPPAHRVLGFICQSGFLGSRKTAFNLPQIHSIGEDSLLVNSQPVTTDAGKVKQLETLLNSEIWSDSGDKVGKIVDYLFDLKTGAIAYYLFASNPWFALADGVYRLSPRQIVSHGQGRVLVADAAARNVEVYQPGIKQKFSQVKESFQEEATEELRSLAEQAQALRDQAKERLQSLTEQTKEKAQDLNQQFREEAQLLAQRAKEKSQSLLEQLQERTQAIADEFIPPVWTEPEPNPDLELDQDFDWDDEWEDASKSGLDDELDDDWDEEAQFPPARAEVRAPEQDSLKPPTQTELPQTDLPPRTSAIARRQTLEPIQPELILPEDLEDDDPWI